MSWQGCWGGGDAPFPPPPAALWAMKEFVFLGQWMMSSLCHAWQVAFGGGSLSSDMFGNLRSRWSNPLSASVSLSKPRAQSGHLELIAPVTQVRSELRANPACQQMAPNEVIVLTVSQKNPKQPEQTLTRVGSSRMVVR